VLGTFPAGSGPSGIAFDGTNMWISSSAGAGYSGSNTGSAVTELSPTGATLHTFSVGLYPAVAFDGTNMWVAISTNSNVTELSPTGATLGTFPVGNAPRGIAFDGTHMWVANMGDGTVTEL